MSFGRSTTDYRRIKIFEENKRVGSYISTTYTLMYMFTSKSRPFNIITIMFKIILYLNRTTMRASKGVPGPIRSPPPLQKYDLARVLAIYLFSSMSFFNERKTCSYVMRARSMYHVHCRWYRLY